MLKQIDIKDYKGLTLQLENVALVNFVVGSPNVGKTRLLDYLHLNGGVLNRREVNTTPSTVIKNDLIKWFKDNDVNKLLLVDNIEMGLHHSQYKELIEAVFNTAKKGVQFFITTQSYEMVEVISEVLSEMEERQDDLCKRSFDDRLFNLYSLLLTQNNKRFDQDSVKGLTSLQMEARGTEIDVTTHQRKVLMTYEFKKITFNHVKNYLISLGWSQYQYESHKTYFCYKHPSNPDKIKITLTNDIYDELYYDWLDKAIRTLASLYKKEAKVVIEEVGGNSISWISV